MTFEAITIRPAEAIDIKEIWDLFHADSKTWTEEQIMRNIQQLLVLTRQDKLLGVLFGKLTPGKEEVIWIVIHPMYPEAQLKELMIQGLKVTQCQALKEKQNQKRGNMFPCFNE
jgi:hypothetical protein